MKLGLAVLPMEVWADVFDSPLITRQKLAQLSNKNGDRQFGKKLQKYLHECGKHTLRFLLISSKRKKESSKCQVRKRKIPDEYCASLHVSNANGMGRFYEDCEFPECEMPENIKTFKELNIAHLDDQVLDFLEKIKPLFTNVYLDIDSGLSAQNVRIFLGHLLPMLGSIRGIYCFNDGLELLERNFPGTLALAKELELRITTPDMIPALINCLSAAQNYDQPRFMKILSFPPETIIAMVNAVRKQFLEAATSLTFVIFLEFYNCMRQLAAEFSYENTTTNEQMSVRNAIFVKPGYHGGGNIEYVEIMRHPIGAEANMREWVKQKAYYEKFYKDYNEADKDAEEECKMISIGWPTLIGYLDHQVLDFLDKIKPLFTNVYLHIGSIESANNMHVLFTHLLPMIGSIRGIYCDNDCMEQLERKFPGILAQAKELDLFHVKTASIPAYLDWLKAPHDFGVHWPRFLIIIAESKTIVAIVDAVRKQFLAATTSSTFVVFLERQYAERHFRVEEFNIENAITKEQLAVRNTLYKWPTFIGSDIHFVEVLRHTTGEDGKMREWVKERAYFEKLYNYASDDDNQIRISQMIIDEHISKKRKAIAMNEHGLDDEENGAAGPSTFAKKMKK